MNRSGLIDDDLTQVPLFQDPRRRNPRGSEPRT
jgi:hypothetical protein